LVLIKKRLYYSFYILIAVKKWPTDQLIIKLLEEHEYYDEYYDKKKKLPQYLPLWMTSIPGCLASQTDV
jgi:hypothetical protein